MGPYALLTGSKDHVLGEDNMLASQRVHNQSMTCKLTVDIRTKNMLNRKHFALHPHSGRAMLHVHSRVLARLMQSGAPLLHNAKYIIPTLPVTVPSQIIQSQG